MLQACNFDVHKAGEALVEGRYKSLLRQWGVIDKRGKGKVRFRRPTAGVACDALALDGRYGRGAKSHVLAGRPSALNPHTALSANERESGRPRVVSHSRV